MNRVSVAMATYNGEKYLREQLDSLYSQSIVPDEIVVCDDCSNDKTIEILEEYHQKNGLRYIVNDLNLGVNKNFEKAIRMCSGSYVAICDQDDIWFPKKIEILLNKMNEVENGMPCVVSSQSISLNDNNKREPFYVKNDSVGVSATLLKSGNVQGCTLMLNRKMIEILRPFPKSYKDVMMYDGYISFVAATCGIKYNLGCVLMAYRHHESNVISKIQHNQTFFVRLRAILRHFKYNRMFPSSRQYTLKYIYDEYFSLMSDDAKKIINSIVAYENGNLFKRIKVICSFHNYDILEKIENILFEIVMFFIPIKK